MDTKNLRLDKTAFRVASIFDEPDGKQFWLAKTPYERLQALEVMRQISYGYDPSTTRLSRVFKVARSE